MVTQKELFESPDPTMLDYRLLSWMKCEVFKLKVDTQNELLACILMLLPA